MATLSCVIPSGWSQWMTQTQRADIERMWNCLVKLGLTGRKLAQQQDPSEHDVFLRQLLNECNVVEEWYHMSLLQNWIDHCRGQRTI